MHISTVKYTPLLLKYTPVLQRSLSIVEDLLNFTCSNLLSKSKFEFLSLNLMWEKISYSLLKVAEFVNKVLFVFSSEYIKLC